MDLGFWTWNFQKGVTQFCRVFWDESLFSPWFLSQGTNLKIPGERFGKVYIKNLGPLFIDGVQLPQGWSHFKEAIYFLALSPQKFLVLILSSSKGWKAELALVLPSGFEHETPGLGIQRFNH